MIRRVALAVAAVATAGAALLLPLQERQRAPAGWLDDLCPPALVETVA